MENILLSIYQLDEVEIKELQLILIRKTKFPILRELYEEIESILSFDFVSQLPVEISEKIFSYLDVVSLCSAAQCSKQWRTIADNNKIWYNLCNERGYIQYKDLPIPNWYQGGRPTSPQAKMHDIPTLIKPVMCQWKMVYMKAYILDNNWRKGIYSVTPSLKAHREPTTALATEGDILVTCSRDCSVYIWSLESVSILHTLDQHTDEVNCMVLHNGRVVTGCSDGLVRIFDCSSGQMLWSLNEGGGPIEQVACNDSFIISGYADCSLQVWNITSDKPIYSYTLQGHTASITCLQVDNSTLFSGSWDSSLRIWNCNEGVCQHILIAHQEGVNCIFIHNNNVISGGCDGIGRIWDVPTGNNTHEMKGHTQEILCIVCNNDIIASSSADSTIRLWSHNGICQHILENHIGLVRCLSIHENRLISGGDRRRLNIWDMNKGLLLHTVHRQQNLIHLMTVNNTMVITVSPDNGSISIIKYW